MVTYTISDGKGGTDTAVVNITVTPVNDAPAGTDKTVTLAEDGSYTFQASDFGFTDPNDVPANAPSAVKITTLPTNGTLTLNGAAVVSGQLIPAGQIGLLVFTPGANANGTGYASFTFQVQDNGGTANGGVDLDQTPNTLVFNVTSENDKPDAKDDGRFQQRRDRDPGGHRDHG